MRLMVESTAKSTSEADKSVRDGNSAVETLSKFTRTHEDEKRTLHASIKELRDSLQVRTCVKDKRGEFWLLLILNCEL